MKEFQPQWEQALGQAFWVEAQNGNFQKMHEAKEDHIEVQFRMDRAGKINSIEILKKPRFPYVLGATVGALEKFQASAGVVQNCFRDQPTQNIQFDQNLLVQM